MSFECSLHAIDPQDVTSDLMPWILGQADFPIDLIKGMGDLAIEMENFLAEALQEGDPAMVAHCLCQLAITYAACRHPYSWGDGASLSALAPYLSVEEHAQLAGWIASPVALFQDIDYLLPGISDHLRMSMDAAEGIGPYVPASHIAPLLEWFEIWLQNAPLELSDGFSLLLPALRHAKDHDLAYWEASELTLPDPLPYLSPSSTQKSPQTADPRQDAPEVGPEEAGPEEAGPQEAGPQEANLQDSPDSGFVDMSGGPSAENSALAEPPEPEKQSPKTDYKTYDGIYLQSWRFPENLRLTLIACYQDQLILTDGHHATVLLDLNGWPPRLKFLEMGPALAAIPGPEGRWLISAHLHGESGTGLFLVEPKSARPYRLPISPPQRQGNRLKRLFMGAHQKRAWNGAHALSWSSVGFVDERPMAISDYASWQMRHIDWPMSWGGKTMGLGGRGLSARKDSDIQPGFFLLHDQQQTADASPNCGLVWNGHVYRWEGRAFHFIGALHQDAFGVQGDSLLFSQQGLYHLAVNGLYCLPYKGQGKAALENPLTGRFRSLRSGPNGTLLLTASRSDSTSSGCIFTPDTGKIVDLSAALFNVDHAEDVGELLWSSHLDRIVGLHGGGLVTLSFPGLQQNPR